MACDFCKSPNQREFPSEINIHPPAGIENLAQPSVWAFPSLLVCLDCGFTKFVLGASELGKLAQNYPLTKDAFDRKSGA
jgi:hypothetical protein